jgi:predicted TIM-barrel fold metal-dependent hydrolase
MPVNHHTGSAAPPMGPTDEDAVVFLLETSWYSHRALTALMVGGVFERHPDLQMVFTEQGTAWVPDELLKLDYFWDRMGNAVGSQEYVWGHPVVSEMSLKPSEYWARQCHVGASFIRPAEVGLRHSVGVDRVMWGSDYPHKEASTPYSTEAIRLAFAGVAKDEAQKMLGGNAAELYGFDMEALRPLAQRIGPRVAEIAEPLGPGLVPPEADKCPAFIGYEFAAG